MSLSQKVSANFKEKQCTGSPTKVQPAAANTASVSPQPALSSSVALRAQSRAALTLLAASCTMNCSGRLAQLVRAPALQAGGRRFEPCTAHHSANVSHRGDVVQLVRTLPCHGRGRGFESRRPRHILKDLQLGRCLFWVQLGCNRIRDCRSQRSSACIASNYHDQCARARKIFILRCGTKDHVLLVPQSRQRINSGRSPCRRIASENRGA